MSGWFFDPLKRGHYDLVLIDCPWKFEVWGEETGITKSAAAQYKVQHIEWIKSLPVKELAAKDCLLLHWVTAPLLDIGIDVLKAWGFTYASFIHWRKVSENGLPMMGTGFRVRTMGELCLIGTLGKPKHKPLKGDFAGIRREHSRKPESLFYMIDDRCKGLTKRAEVFARQRRPGWDSWGDELDKFERRTA